ncbi:hypothetical protein TNCV_397781 [Trichonephila clavipes]|nr:hypothetical protein TNCV_397781 [Trichonephila clavipes]
MHKVKQWIRLQRAQLLAVNATLLFCSISFLMHSKRVLPVKGEKNNKSPLSRADMAKLIVAPDSEEASEHEKSYR